jgi:cysteine synthase A
MSSLEMRGALARMACGTPTVALWDEASGCTLWLKVESLLPSGSTKDRVASFILNHGIEAGKITADTLVVEASSGSTSISFAMGCAMLGVKFRAVMPEGVSRERVLMIRRFGGEIALTPREGGVRGAIEACRRMAAEDPRVFLPRQFENELNALAHQRTTGPELLAQVGRTIHGFVAGVGTGGTLMGIARALREAGQRTHIARALPDASLCFSNEPEICGGVPGVIEGLSKILDPASVALDEDIRVGQGEAYLGARELCARGFSVGPSSGLNFVAARKLAARLGPGHHIATVLCDRMERYFSTEMFDDLDPSPARPG